MYGDHTGESAKGQKARNMDGFIILGNLAQLSQANLSNLSSFSLEIDPARLLM